jgi:phage gpG-like protein
MAQEEALLPASCDTNIKHFLNMEIFEQFIKNILQDAKVELSDEFDRNFERKAFFTDKWPASKINNNRGSLMARKNTLRNSLKAEEHGNELKWSSSIAYATIHNEGGEITVSAGMKRFFWAMFYKASKAISTKKDGTNRTTKRNLLLTDEAANWKALALMKVGQKIKIPKRQFIGWHPVLDNSVEQIVEANLEELNDQILQIIKPKK